MYNFSAGLSSALLARARLDRVARDAERRGVPPAVRPMPGEMSHLAWSS